MSSPEVERFEISENDLEDIYNPGQRRFRQTKHQATYGKLLVAKSRYLSRPFFPQDFVLGAYFIWM